MTVNDESTRQSLLSGSWLDSRNRSGGLETCPYNVTSLCLAIILGSRYGFVPGFLLSSGFLPYIECRMGVVFRKNVRAGTLFIRTARFPLISIRFLFPSILLQPKSEYRPLSADNVFVIFSARLLSALRTSAAAVKKHFQDFKNIKKRHQPV